jgi:hypothetical protein
MLFSGTWQLTFAFLRLSSSLDNRRSPGGENLGPVAGIAIVLAVLGFLALVFGIVILKVMRAKNTTASRSLQMQAVANQMKWPFYPVIGLNSLPNAASFQLFEQRFNHYSGAIANLLSGNIHDAQVLVFDYSYLVGRNDYGRDVSGRHQTVVFIMSPELNLPYFNLSPSQMINLHLNRLQFPAHLAFTDSYTLVGNDELAIRRVFNDQVIAFFESNRGASVEGGGGQFFLYYDRTLVPPPNLQNLINEGVRLFTLIKQPHTVNAAAMRSAG